MNIPIHTVITAAGDSRPLFLGAGFSTPKNLVRWQGTEVLVRAINSYAGDLARTSIAMHRDEAREWHTPEIITAACPGVSVSLVNAGARGALASASVALGAIPPDAPLVVAAGDSEVEGGIGAFTSSFVATGIDAATIAFRSSNPRWSYLATGSDGHVRQVAEKRVIGPLATTGVFFFRQASIFLQAAEWCLVNNAIDRGAFYVSTTMNFLIREGLSVSYAEIPRDKYRSWSLPTDFVEQSA